MNIKKSFWLKVLGISNILALIAALIVNYLATNLPIGGMSTGELSDLYPNLFVPTGLTFAIWGVIYLMLIGFVIWQIIDLFKKETKGFTKKIGIWFLLSCLANIGWIFAWHNRAVLLSVLIIIAFLIIQIVLVHKVQVGKKIGSWIDKLLIQIPFSIYLGWLSVATIANITALLVNIGWSGRGISEISWTIIVIIVAMILALLSLYKNKDIVFSLVIIWAFLGIILKRLGAEIIYPQIIRILGVSIIIISAGIGYKFKDWKNS